MAARVSTDLPQPGAHMQRLAQAPSLAQHAHHLAVRHLVRPPRARAPHLRRNPVRTLRHARWPLSCCRSGLLKAKRRQGRPEEQGGTPAVKKPRQLKAREGQPDEPSEHPPVRKPGQLQARQDGSRQRSRAGTLRRNKLRPLEARKGRGNTRAASKIPSRSKNVRQLRLAEARRKQGCQGSREPFHK